MSQLYLLPCSCGQKTPVSVAQAGGHVTCACGKSLPVPTLRGLRELEIAPAAAPEKKPGWSRVHGAVFASGLTVAAIGIVLLAMSALQYSQIVGFGYTKDRTQDVLKSQQADIEGMSPVQVLAEWRKDVEEGLGEQEEPPWSKFKRLAASNIAWIKFGVAAVVGGILVSLITLLVPARPVTAAG
jgi:hypothetical protein